MKEKKLIIGATAIIAIIIIIGVVLKMSGDNEQDNPATSATQTTTAVQVKDDGETNFWDNVEIYEGDGNVTAVDETDDNGQVVPNESGENATKAKKDDTTKKEGSTDINLEAGGDAETGETISEEYPGQADGWSPIVSPDDLD